MMRICEGYVTAADLSCLGSEYVVSGSLIKPYANSSDSGLPVFHETWGGGGS